MTERGDVVVYSAIVGGYDVLLPPRVRDPGIRYVLFTDRRPRFAWNWEVRPLPAELRDLPPALANRWCKFFPHRLLPEADVSIYLDGNIRPIGSLLPLIEDFVASGRALGLFRHQLRTRVTEEAEACVIMGKVGSAEASRIAAQVRRYLDDGLPRDHVLTENGILFRRHGAPGLDAAMTLWWDELRNGAPRDQISLPWVRHATGLGTRIWDWNYKNPNPRFQHVPVHRRAGGLVGDLAFLVYALRDDARWLGALNALSAWLKRRLGLIPPAGVAGAERANVISCR